MSILNFIIILLIILVLSMFFYNKYSETYMDYGFMKPYNRNYKYYGLKAEIHPLQMIGLLNFLKTKYEPDENRNSNKLIEAVNETRYKAVKKWIIDIISKVACGMSEDYNIDEASVGKFRKIQTTASFEIIEEELVKSEISLDNKIETFKFILKIYREPAEIGFIIYFDIGKAIYDDTYYFNNYQVKGVQFQDEIKFNNLNNPDLDDKCSLGLSNAKCNTLISYNKDYNKNKVDFVNNHKIQKAIDIEESEYKCFFKDALNEIECNSHELIKVTGTDDTTKSAPGLWAKGKCTIDEECPFFKANQNYENVRGGCINNQCELPINMKLLTPTIVDPKSIPLCHNCNSKPGCKGIECSQCCKDQLNNKMYPNLKNGTPDYAFNDDMVFREDQSDILEGKGLSSFKLAL